MVVMMPYTCGSTQAVQVSRVVTTTLDDMGLTAFDLPLARRRLCWMWV